MFVKILFISLFFYFSESANILICIPYAAQSHYVMQRPIGLELARRGHNVTVITAYKETNVPSNYHQVLADNVKVWDVIGTERPNIFTLMKNSDFYQFNQLWLTGIELTKKILKSKEIKHFLAQNNTYDLVISEQFVQEAFNILAHKYNAPLILITTFKSCLKHNIVTRNPLQLTTLTLDLFPIKYPTSFYGRLNNYILTYYEQFWWRFWYLKKHEDLIKKYIPNLKEPVPSLYDVQRNVSLMFMNSHFTFGSPVAYLPNIVEIGGIHLKENNTILPPDLQKILDDATDGVIYVNFGSNVQSSELPEDKKNAFINVFKRLNQTVLWKWEDNTLEGKPKNVFVRKWMPQVEILSHPNIKIFISHGGLIGTQEAIFHGVPIIGIPIYGDQYNNVLQAQQLGIGKILEFHDVNESTLLNAIEEFLRNDTYKKNAVELAKRFKDRPLSALDTAVYWIEYVIRYKGAPHLKNKDMELSWIAYNMLDVYLFVMIVILLIVLSIFVILQRIYKFLMICNTLKFSIDKKEN